MLLTHYIHDLKRLIATDRDYPFEQIDSRLVEHWMHMQRALWLRNEYNKNRTVESNVYQILEGLELEQIDRSDATWLPKGTKFLRTKYKIPRPIELHSSYLIQIRSTILGDEYYNLEKFDNFRYKGHGKFNKKMVYCFYHKDYIYINITDWNPKIGMLKFISADIVAENPSDIYRIQDLDPLYEEYPIPASMWEFLKDAVMKSNIARFVQTKEDEKHTVVS